MDNEGFVRDSLLKMVHNPDGHDCILGDIQPSQFERSQNKRQENGNKKLLGVSKTRGGPPNHPF